MKVIGIIAQPRSGSTTLCKAIEHTCRANIKKVLNFGELFNGEINTPLSHQSLPIPEFTHLSKIDYLNNLIQICKRYRKGDVIIIKFLEINQSPSELESMLKMCDFVINLYRDDIVNASISYAYAEINGSWREKKISPTDINISKCYNYIVQYYKRHIYFSELLKIIGVNGYTVSHEQLHDDSVFRSVMDFLGEEGLNANPFKLDITYTDKESINDIDNIRHQLDSFIKMKLQQ